MEKFMQSLRRIRVQKGITLVELMVALVLSSLVVLGIAQAFIANRTTYRLQEAQSRLQENARFALSVISSELRKAGFLGCVSTNLSISTGDALNGPPASFRPWTGVEGWEADNTAFGQAITFNTASLFDPTVSASPSWSTANGATLDAGTMSVRDSDIIRVWYADSEKGNLTALGNAPTFTSMTVALGDVYVINDCGAAEFIQACSGTASPGAPATTFNTTGCSTPGNTVANITVRPTDSEIRKLNSTLFFVGKRGNTDTNPPALFWRRMGNNAAADTAEELVEGVESLQFMYGEDTDGDNVPDYYVPADRITQWTQVVSVKVSLLMRSVGTSIEQTANDGQNITTTDQAIAFNGRTITPTDRRLRRVFSTTIAFRNKLI